MAGQRFLVDASFAPLERGGDRHRALANGRIDANKVRKMTVVVPAGESKLVILDEIALPSVAYRLLGLKSSVEGVEWWPIDSTTPSVDPDTREFGWLLDYGWPNFEHNHGQSLAGVPEYVDHSGTHLTTSYRVGTRTMYSELPCFVDHATSKIDPLVNPATGVLATSPMYTQIKTGGLVNFDGEYINLASTNQDTLYDRGRNVGWLLGPDNYENLGTAYDGLGFFAYFYVNEADYLDATGHVINPARQKFALNLYSYPFSVARTNPDDLDDETYMNFGGAGKVPLCGTTDLMMDFNTNVSNALGYASVQSAGLGHGGYRYWRTTNPTPAYNPADGYQIIPMAKPDFTQVNGTDSVTPGTYESVEYGYEVPIWSRITAGMIRCHADKSATVDARLINIWFGPQPGKSRILRPYELTSETAWSTSSVPAIGIQNPTEMDAEIEIRSAGK